MTDEEAQYRRIGWVAECTLCDEELHGFWEVSKHHFMQHTRTGKIIGRIKRLL